MLPEEGFIRWLLWAWERLLRLEGGTEDFRRRRRLVVPVAENFPVDPGLEGHDLADDYFLFVKEHAGVQGWPLELVPEDGWADDDDLGVPYDPCLLGTPTRLVAQLAHGVAHLHHLVVHDLHLALVMVWILHHGNLQHAICPSALCRLGKSVFAFADVDFVFRAHDKL